MAKDKRDNPGGKILRLDDFRGRLRKVQKREAEMQGREFDEATRDLHAAVSSTLKFIYLARLRLGLPEL